MYFFKFPANKKKSNKDFSQDRRYKRDDEST